jgi:hypothetical protein
MVNDPNIMYGSEYGYRSSLNPSMTSHLHDIGKYIQEQADIKAGDSIVDIGSNDGTLLNYFVDTGAHLVGIDPGADGMAEYYHPDIERISHFFSDEYVRNKSAKIVTTIAMFYDLDAPVEFASSIARTLADDGIWVLEQNYMPSTMVSGSYDTVGHEHVEYYSLRQIDYIMSQVGLEIVHVSTNRTNGCSFCVTVAHTGKRQVDHSVFLMRNTEALMNAHDMDTKFRKKVESHRSDLLYHLATAKEKGRKIVGYGASTRGNTILQYCNISKDILPVIGEVNKKKWGRVTPGTCIPIEPEDDVRARGPDIMLVSPWHFKDFIVKKEKQYIENGGSLLFPLPEAHIIDKETTRTDS